MIAFTVAFLYTDNVLSLTHVLENGNGFRVRNTVSSLCICCTIKVVLTTINEAVMFKNHTTHYGHGQKVTTTRRNRWNISILICRTSRGTMEQDNKRKPYFLKM